MTKPGEWQLGQTSEHYESGGHGPGDISTGINDPGGVSYGTYQLSSKKGTVREYLDQSAYKDQFKGLEQTTPAFDAKWRELAKNDPGFGQDQYNFIKTSHYEKQVAHLKADGLDLTHRGPAVQDALWSTSVQYRGHTKDIFEKGLQEKFGKGYKLSDLSDKDIVGAAQDYKTAHNDTLFASAPAKTRQNILSRIENEKADLLSLADGKVVDHRSHHAPDHAASHEAAAAPLRQGMHNEQVQKLQTQLGELGYLDNTATPDGKFGPVTRDAVKAYQHDHHLPEVGQAGPATQKAMQADLQTHRQDNRGASPPMSAVSDSIPRPAQPSEPSTAGPHAAPKLSPPLDPPALKDFRDPAHPLNERYQMFRDALGEQGFHEARPTLNDAPAVRGYSAEQKDRLAAGFTAQMGSDRQFNTEIQHFRKDGDALLAIEHPERLGDTPLVLALPEKEALARSPEQHAAGWRARELPEPQAVNTQRPDPRSLSPEHPGHPDHPRNTMFEHTRDALTTEYARWGMQKGAEQLDRETVQVMTAARKGQMDDVGAVRLMPNRDEGKIGAFPKMQVFETAQAAAQGAPSTVIVQGQTLQQAPPVQQAAPQFHVEDQQATQQMQQNQQLQAQVNAQAPQGPGLGR